MICPTLKGKTFEEEIILYCPECESSLIIQDSNVPIFSNKKGTIIPLKCLKCEYTFSFKIIMYKGKLNG